MGLPKLLFRTRSQWDGTDDPADDPFCDDDEFSLRDRAAARLGGFGHCEEDADTVDEMRRETGDRND